MLSVTRHPFILAAHQWRHNIWHPQTTVCEQVYDPELSRRAQYCKRVMEVGGDFATKFDSAGLNSHALITCLVNGNSERLKKCWEKHHLSRIKRCYTTSLHALLAFDRNNTCICRHAHFRWPVGLWVGMNNCSEPGTNIKSKMVAFGKLRFCEKFWVCLFVLNGWTSLDLIMSGKHKQRTKGNVKVWYIGIEHLHVLWVDN